MSLADGMPRELSFGAFISGARGKLWPSACCGVTCGIEGSGRRCIEGFPRAVARLLAIEDDKSLCTVRRARAGEVDLRVAETRAAFGDVSGVSEAAACFLSASSRDVVGWVVLAWDLIAEARRRWCSSRRVRIRRAWRRDSQLEPA